MTTVGWWANNTPLEVAVGYRFRGRGGHQRILVPTEHRTMHLHVIGASGSGKSRWIQHILRQDVEANRGFTLVDPHGDLYRQILAHIAEMALPGRLTSELINQLGDKLVLIEPAYQGLGCPAINLLEVAPGQVGYPLIDGIIETIRELWPDCFGPRMEDVCRHALLLLQELGLTVLEMLPLLSDANFRAALVERSTNPDIRLYFQEHLGGLRPAELKTWVESSRNKWSAFLSNPFIRPLLGQTRSTIDFRAILDQGKWLLINVSRDKLKESRRLLGALLVNLIHQAAIAREHVAVERRVFHALVVDEFQEFFCPTFTQILEGARKYGLSLTLLHQNLTQPPFDQKPGVMDTILANTSTHICFVVARKDAERMAGEMFFPSGREVKHQRTWLFGIPLEEPKTWSMADERAHYASELMKQRQAEVFIKFKGRGEDEPFVGQVPHVPDIPVNQEKIDILRRHVAARYYRPLSEIDAEIRRRWQAFQGGAVTVRPTRRNWQQ